MKKPVLSKTRTSHSTYTHTQTHTHIHTHTHTTRTHTHTIYTNVMSDTIKYEMIGWAPSSTK